MKKSEQYLEKLKREMEVWQQKVESLDGDTISVTHPYYIRSVNASNKYATAKYMMKLMQEEAQLA